MIHMLSRFNLRSGVTAERFTESYTALVAYMTEAGLAEGTGNLGVRLQNTPMDTDLPTAPDFYVVMHFRDREQLDASYAHIAEGHISAEHQRAHVAVQGMIKDAVFTCWEDQDAG